MPSTIVARTALCWPNLFTKAVIVVMPGEGLYVRGLLKVSFTSFLRLSAVEYPVMIDSGLILMGYSTALIPVDTDSSHRIIWHLETFDEKRQIRKTELRAIHGRWLQRTTLEELQSEEALLGWCTVAQVQLGTDSLNANVKWSNAEIKPTTWRWKGANLQFLAQSGAPVQVGGLLGFAWERFSNTVHRNEEVILYNVATRRAWLVPLLCIYHHMLLIYQSVMFPAGSQGRIPTSSIPSLTSSLDTLRDAGGTVIEGTGSDALTVRDLPPNGSRIYGYELLDLVVGSPRSDLKEISMKREGLGWAPLLDEVPCLFCADLGDAIVGARSTEPNAPCSYLPAGRDLLASTVDRVLALRYKRGGPLTTLGSITRNHVLDQEGDPFAPCDHGAGTSSCWDGQESIIQRLILKKDKKTAAEPACSRLFPRGLGAVVLGDERRQGSKRSYEVWR
ncbi:hypothetical protein BJX61DRAFT_531672 [Aspergillus egyptiacus]|nr:hypothetical protein BJX61DRAFT_531672 [Aspergillus egyptiacus]